MSPLLASLSGSITHQVAAHGVYAVFVLMALDAVLPAGSEIVMVFAGAIAAGAGSITLQLPGSHLGPGLASFLVLAGTGTIGYLVGGVIGWWIGHRGGTPFIARHRRWLHLTPHRLEQAEHWFARWGQAAVLVGRVVPFVRSFVSIPAGLFGMTLTRYAALTLIGSAIWAFGLAGVGWALGTRYTNFNHDFKYAEYAVGLLVLITFSMPLVARVLPARHSKTGKK